MSASTPQPSPKSTPASTPVRAPVPALSSAASSRTLLFALAALLFALFVVFVGSGPRSRVSGDDVELVVPQAINTDPPPPTTAKPSEDCQQGVLNAQASYAASANPSPHAAIDAIRKRGKLVAGVSADTLLFGARNPISGQLEGLDVDLVRQLAKRIFASDDPKYVQFKVITYAQRIPSLQSGAVDVVAHSMTINCRRWNQIAFSTEYYAAGQKLLVRSDSTATDITKLPSGSRICVPAGGTSVENLRKYASQNFQAVEVNDITECLVKMQQGQADAALSDDTVVQGMATQDPFVKVIGEKLSEEPYGMGFNANHVDLVLVANQMLKDLRADTTNGMDALLAKHKLAKTEPLVDETRPLPSGWSAPGAASDDIITEPTTAA